MFTERQAIQEELKDNRLLMAELRTRNKELINRLGALDDRDMSDKVSYDGLNTITSSMTDILGRLSGLIPSISPEQVINELSKDVKDDTNTSTVHIEPLNIKPIEEPTPVQKAANKAKIESSKTRKTMSRERSASIIKEILVENKSAMKTRELEAQFVDRTGKKYANFHEVLTATMKLYPSVQKAGFGKYTYVDTSKNTHDGKDRNQLMAKFKEEQRIKREEQYQNA